MRIINQWMYYVFIMWWRIMYAIGFYKPKKYRSLKDKEDEYTEPLKERFLKSFDLHMNHYSNNILPIFYEKSKYETCVKDVNNELEKTWRTRMLFENTPRGNIIMFYDSYKMGFSYFCDQNIVSYDILNAVAMKYVIIFKCRDFFMDESVVPKQHISPLISIHFPAEVQTTNPSTNPNSKNLFIKRNHTKDTTSTKPMETKKPEYKKNTFLYLGKTNNFQVLQKQPKRRKILAKFTSPLLESIERDSGISREVFSYRKFKELSKTINNNEEVVTN